MRLWKVQKFFGDVVYDLRNRRLLPIAILLLVAMIAVPVLIARGSSGSSSSSAQPSSASVGPAPETENAVISYNPPGIREYKKRLNDLAAKDPFRQQFSQSAAASAASQLNSTAPTPTQTGSTSSSSSTSVSVSPSTGSSSTGSSSTPSGSKALRLRRYFHSVADLSVGEVGQPATRHKKIKSFTTLPGDTAPVLVYIGSTLDAKKAVFSVSKFVDNFTGPGTCGPSPGECTLLALTVGESEQLHYSVDGKTYQVTIHAIRRVFTKKPPTG
jgi:hypothetical protein